MKEKQRVLKGSLSNCFLLKANSNSAVRLLQKDSTKKSFKHSPGSPNIQKKQLIRDIESTRSELEHKIQEQRKNLMRNKTFIAPSKAQGSLWSVTNKTVERLLESERRKRERLEAQKAVHEKARESTLQAKPSITKKSTEINNAKEYVPLHSQQRINQMEREKRKKMEELKKKLEKTEEIFTEKKSKSNIKSTKCSLYKNIHNDRIDNTEERELESCTFRPSTDSKSTAIFRKMNSKKRSVVQRLISYGKLQEEMLKQKIEESIPSFHPRTKGQIKKKSSMTLHRQVGVNGIDNLIMERLFI